MGNAQRGENLDPGHPQRPVLVQIFDNNNNQVGADIFGTVFYDAASGLFKGPVSTNIASGVYTVKVKSERYLRKLLPGIQTITSKQTNNLAPGTLIVGDINNDNELNIIDYNFFRGCYQQSPISDACIDADLNDNGVIDAFDYNLFIGNLSHQQGD